MNAMNHVSMELLERAARDAHEAHARALGFPHPLIPWVSLNETERDAWIEVVRTALHTLGWLEAVAS